jgi:LPS sulfotransferase NodH
MAMLRHDSPSGVLPERAVIIASIPRSGSSLLSRAVTATGQFGDFHEHFNFHSLSEAMEQGFRFTPTPRGLAGMLKRRLQGDRNWRATSWMTNASKRRHLDWLVEQQLASGNVFGCKTHWHQYRFMLLDAGVDLAEWGAPVDWVSIRRRDHLRQAVSHARASQTLQWNSASKTRGTAVYDRKRIDRALAMIERSEQAWDAYFAERGIEPYRVVYEDLDADYQKVLVGVLEHLGAQVPEGGTIADLVVPRQLKRQADELNDEWRKRYLDETRS